MKCHVCGGTLDRAITDLPFRVAASTIVVVKKLPVLECSNCTEYTLEDHVMAKVEDLLDKTDEAAELEVVAYAA